MDPLLLLLPTLEACGSRLSPLATVLSFATCPALPAVMHHCAPSAEALASMCDVEGT